MRVKKKEKSPGRQIVFLDAKTLFWEKADESLKGKLARVKFYDQTASNDLFRRALSAQQIITNKCLIDRKLISSLKSLQAVHVAATGVNNVDLQACRERGIAVTNVKGYSTSSVAEMTLLFILTLSYRLREVERSVGKKAWSDSSSFTLTSFPYSELRGKTLGIVGYGAIGREVERLAKSFGLNVLIAKIPGRKYPKNVKRFALCEVLRKSDFVSLHAPLTPLTSGLMNKKRLSMMRPSAYLINMARGPLVVEGDLAWALKTKRIAGAASDVMNEEPPPRGHIFYRTKNWLVTPHVAWASRESRIRLWKEILSNVQAFEKGLKRNRVV